MQVCIYKDFLSGMLAQLSIKYTNTNTTVKKRVCVSSLHVSIDCLAGELGGLGEGVQVGEHLASGALQTELIKVGVGQNVLLGREALTAQLGNLNTFVILT